MNTALLKKFTPEVLNGAGSLGVEDGALIALLGITPAAFSRLIAGAKSLDTRQAIAIERKTGRSIGELAVLGIECKAPPERRASEVQLVRDTLDLMQSFTTTPAVGASRKTAKRLSSRS